MRTEKHFYVKFDTLHDIKYTKQKCECSVQFERKKYCCYARKRFQFSGSPKFLCCLVSDKFPPIEVIHTVIRFKGQRSDGVTNAQAFLWPVTVKGHREILASFQCNRWQEQDTNMRLACWLLACPQGFECPQLHRFFIIFFWIRNHFSRHGVTNNLRLDALDGQVSEMSDDKIRSTNFAKPLRKHQQPYLLLTPYLLEISGLRLHSQSAHYYFQ